MKAKFNDYVKQENRKRLEEIHRQKTSDEAHLTTILAAGINKKFASYERIVAGEVNEVYLVTLTDQQQVILRIGHNEKDFQAETWAIEQARKQGVPTATILAIGTIPTETKQLSYSIQTPLSGTSLDILLWSERIAPARAQQLTVQAGALLAKIHAVSTTGYGQIDHLGNGAYPSLADWTTAHLAKEQEYQELFARHGLDTATLEKSLTILHDAPNILHATPQLLHMDYGPKHIFVDNDDCITGIIDFEGANSGDPVLDFASWDYWFKNAAPIDWIYEGYEQIAPLGDDLQQRRTVAMLLESIRLLDCYDRTHLPEETVRASNYIRELVQQAAG